LFLYLLTYNNCLFNRHSLRISEKGEWQHCVQYKYIVTFKFSVGNLLVNNCYQFPVSFVFTLW